jgi:hypothetical protein
LAYYSLRGDRKAISLSAESQFFLEVEKVELLVDEYDNNVVYGGAKSKEAACIFVADFTKGKLLAVGYLSSYEDIRVDFRENITLSVCCNNGSHNYLKSLRYASGQWEIKEEVYKKIQNGLAFQHEILSANRVLFATRSYVYHFEGSDLLQTIEMKNGEKIRQILKINRGMVIFGMENTVEILIEDSDEVTLLPKGVLPIHLEPEDSIESALLSYSTEEVIVRTSTGNLYTWKCEHIDLDASHSDFTFIKVESSCSGSHQGSISISTGRKYCMLAGERNVTLWSIEKN